MIAYVEGRPLSRGERSCVLLTTGGVGYEIFATGPTLARLSPEAESVGLHTQTIVREDDITLYGFTSQDERDTFASLITISGLGPKIGLAILTQFTPDELRSLVAMDDPQALTVVPGIGKKTGQRIFLELKYKLKTDDEPALVTTSGAPSAFRDALAGLTNLGYAEDEARPALEAVLRDEPDLDVSGALRAALKRLANAC